MKHPIVQGWFCVMPTRIKEKRHKKKIVILLTKTNSMFFFPVFMRCFYCLLEKTTDEFLKAPGSLESPLIYDFYVVDPERQTEWWHSLTLYDLFWFSKVIFWCAYLSALKGVQHTHQINFKKYNLYKFCCMFEWCWAPFFFKFICWFKR